MGTDTVKTNPEDSISNCDSVTSTNNYSSASTIHVNSVIGLLNGGGGGGGGGKQSISGPSSSSQANLYSRPYDNQSENSSRSSSAGTNSSDTSSESITSTNSIIVGKSHAIVASKNNYIENKQQKNEKKAKKSGVTYEDNKEGNKDNGDDEDVKHGKEDDGRIKEELLEAAAHCKGIINRLIDKELIRTAIMEQDEESLPVGIQQGYFKVREMLFNF